jgi:hypothetical protein
MIPLDFGKNKGRTLADCETAYLKWLVTHEKVLAERNRWAARDAKFILDRLAQVAAPTVATTSTKGNENWQEWHESLKRAEIDRKIAKHLSSTPTKVDIGLKGNLNVSRAFSLMR